MTPKNSDTPVKPVVASGEPTSTRPHRGRYIFNWSIFGLGGWLVAGCLFFLIAIAPTSRVRDFLMFIPVVLMLCSLLASVNAWHTGTAELRAIKEQRADASGERLVKKGRVLGMIGVLIPMVLMVISGVVFIIWFFKQLGGMSSGIR